MKGTRVAKKTPTLHEGSRHPLQRPRDSARATGQSEGPVGIGQNHFNSVTFSPPCVSRTGLQIGPSCSTGRNRIGWTARRTRTHASTLEYRRRAGQVPPSRARPFEAAEAAEAGRPRLSLGAAMPGPADPGKHMPRSNRLHEANDPKSTAQSTTQCRTDRDIKLNADSQSARTGGRQVRLSDFEFIPASQLWHNDREGDGAAKEREDDER